MATYRIRERGNSIEGGFKELKIGIEVCDHHIGELLRIVSMGSTILTDSRGNYILAECEPSTRGVMHLSDDEFSALPDVDAELVEPPRRHSR